MMQVIESAAMVKQYRFPKSKKRRIRKKWSKVSSNFKPDDKVLMAENTLFCHPSVAPILRKEMQASPQGMMRGNLLI